MIKLTKMDWDSEFWGIDIYNADECRELIDYKSEFDKMINDNPSVIQTLTRDDNIEYINFLEAVGFRFIESKVNLVKRVQNQSNAFNKYQLKDVKLEDIENYKDQFYNLYGEITRFKFSSEKKINNFYYEWVTKSIRGKFDDNCIGYYEDSVLKGFMTYKIKEKKVIIGLFGVLPEYQGQKISQKILSNIDEIAVINNCSEIIVATQGKNIKAINAYIKSGFFIESIKHWYYFRRNLNDRI